MAGTVVVTTTGIGDDTHADASACEQDEPAGPSGERVESESTPEVAGATKSCEDKPAQPPAAYSSPTPDRPTVDSGVLLVDQTENRVVVISNISGVLDWRR